MAIQNGRYQSNYGAIVEAYVPAQDEEMPDWFAQAFNNNVIWFDGDNIFLALGPEGDQTIWSDIDSAVVVYYVEQQVLDIVSNVDFFDLFQKVS